MNGRLLGSILLSAALLSADTLVMKDGTRFDGRYLGGDDRSVRFDNGSGPKTYTLSSVDSLRFTSQQTSYAPAPPPPPPGNGPQPSYAPAPSYPPPPPGEGQQASYNNSAYSNSGPPPGVSQNLGGQDIPSGTQVVVRLIDPVNSDTDHLGQTYRASLDEPVVVNGQTVLPRGADALAALVDAQHSGKIQGRTELTLDLKTITANGRSYTVTTTGVSQVSASRGARSAKVIGGTTAMGAVIGALAGGGRGAAIGAGSGAAAGTAAQVMTAGQKVKIPSETRLTFTLQNPLNMQ